MHDYMDHKGGTAHVPLQKMTRYQSAINPTQENGTILIIDDVPANVGALFDFLKSYGFKILVAEDGASGLQKAEYVAPDLILLDVMMPGLDGFETCQRLKTNPKTKEVPVIFMTALSDTPYTLKGFELGAVDYVTKPIQQEEVLARINAQLMVSGYYKDLKAKNHQLCDINDQLQQEIFRRQSAERALEKANETLRKLAALDPLTEIANRRVFDEQILKEWQRMSRQSSPLSLIICDVDFFKDYNDTYGHQAGDRCLQKVAKAIGKAAQRSQDVVARYGGEEFVVLAPDIDLPGMVKVAEGIQRKIQDLNLLHESSKVNQHITVSIGVACTIPHHTASSDALLGCADAALYEAKSEGRNRVIGHYLAAPK